MICRPRHQVEIAAQRLEEQGASVYGLPMVEIAPPMNMSLLQDALRNLEQFDWVIFTSANGVEAVSREMELLGIHKDALRSRRLAVIGPATAASLERHFRAPDLIPETFVSEAIADSLTEIKGLRFLLPRADIARPDLANALEAKGGIVQRVAAYRIQPTNPEVSLSSPPDYITLTSAAITQAAVDALNGAGKADWWNISKVVCIGPITAERAKSLNIPVAAVAKEYTIEGLAQAILDLEEQDHARV